MWRCVIVLCIVLVGCVPAEQPVPVQLYEFPLLVSNGETVAMNYCVYLKPEDMTYDVNPMLRLRLPPGADTSIPMNLADTGEFYVDIYSDDHSITNWGSGHTANTRTMQSLRDIGLPGIGTRYIGGLRNYYLDGDKQETSWRAVNILDTSGSIWQNLGEHQRYYRLILRKAGTCTLVSRDNNGADVAFLSTMFAQQDPGSVFPYYINIETDEFMLHMTLLHYNGINYNQPCTADTTTLVYTDFLYTRNIVFVRE